MFARLQCSGEMLKDREDIFKIFSVCIQTFTFSKDMLLNRMKSKDKCKVREREKTTTTKKYLFILFTCSICHMIINNNSLRMVSLLLNIN